MSTTNTAEYQRAYREHNPTYAQRDKQLKQLRRRAAMSVANNHPDEWERVKCHSPRSWTSDKKYGRLIASFRIEYEIAYAELRRREGLD